MSDIRTRIIAAFLASDAGYLAKTLATRNPGPDARGSTFLEAQTLEGLQEVAWELVNDPAIKAPAVGFTAKIPGLLGLVELDKLDPSTPCRMELGHKGEIPFVAPVIDKSHVSDEARKVEFTTLLLGPKAEGDETEIVWTFYPGGSVPPSTMAPSPETEAVTTVGQAIALGFGLGKIAG